MVANGKEKQCVKGQSFWEGIGFIDIKKWKWQRQSGEGGLEAIDITFEEFEDINEWQERCFYSFGCVED